MERYLLLFSFGSNNDYGEDILNLSQNYLESLNDEQQFYSHSRFLKYFNVISVKIALVVLNQNGNKVQWKSIDVQDTDNLKELILESKQIEMNKMKSKLKLPDIDPMKTAIENFHELADALPYSGSFLLDLVWFYTNDDKIRAIEENYEFYGAIKRLVNWHNCQITMIVPEKNTVNQNITEWMKFLNGIIFPITTSSKIHFPSNLIWRGKLHVKDAKLGTEISLPGFQLQYVTSKCFHSLYNTEDSQIQMDQACFSVKMEIVESVSSDSIPSYFITSEKYHLSIINAKASLKQSSKWFANIIRNPEISFILRLGYVDEGLPPFSCSIFNPTTKNWIQSISNGNFKFSVPNISGDSKQILFLLTGNKFNTTSCTTLYRLRNPDELNGSISQQIFMNMPLCKADNEDSEAQCVVENVETLPYLNQKDFSVFLELICDVQNQIIENWLDHLEAQGLTRNLSQEELSFALRTIQNELVKRTNPYIETGKETETSTSEDQINELIPEYLVDPNDWSERRAILNQEILAEKFKRFKSTDTLAGMFPPSLDNAQMWNCSQILKCFHKSGLPRRHHMKNAVAIGGSIETYQCPLRAVVSEEEMLSLSWPDIKHCHFHDIYYNRDDSSEQLEERFCKIKERFIRHEISCTHLRANSEKKMLPICKNTFSDGWTSSALKNSNECPFTKKKKEHSNGSANKIVSPRRSPRKKASLETSQVLRRSPRKHQSSQLNKSTVGTRNSPSFKQKSHTKKKHSHQQKPNIKNSCSKKLCSNSTLSDRHIKKLREAVYNALSSEGIDMDHKLFNVCGKKLFAVCKTLVHDVLGSGRTSELMRTIAQAHVKQVVEFEKLLDKKS